MISANPRVFNHERAFKDLGFIDWRQTRNFSIGDIVYVYVTYPIPSVNYKTEIVDVGMSFTNISNFSQYWKGDKGAGESNYKYARLRLLMTFNDERLKLKELRNHGMKYAPQSPMKANDVLIQYLTDIEGDLV